MTTYNTNLQPDSRVLNATNAKRQGKRSPEPFCYASEFQLITSVRRGRASYDWLKSSPVTIQTRKSLRVTVADINLLSTQLPAVYCKFANANDYHQRQQLSQNDTEARILLNYIMFICIYFDSLFILSTNQVSSAEDHSFPCQRQRRDPILSLIPRISARLLRCCLYSRPLSFICILMFWPYQ